MFQLLQKLRARLRRPTLAVPCLAVTDDGVTLFAGDRPVWTLAWREVQRIDAYQRDLLTVDQTCLDFTMQSQELAYLTDDQMAGFEVLCAQLPRVFPSIAPEWWGQVAFPAFATNHRILYLAPDEGNLPVT